LSACILVVDDEPDVEALFRQQFRRDLRAGRFAMEFAQSAPMAFQRIINAGDEPLILILSDIPKRTSSPPGGNAIFEQSPFQFSNGRNIVARNRGFQRTFRGMP
jgi:hypothetical protein